jgi:hypothetical protein
MAQGERVRGEGINMRKLLVATSFLVLVPLLAHASPVASSPINGGVYTDGQMVHVSICDSTAGAAPFVMRV